MKRGRGTTGSRTRHPSFRPVVVVDHRRMVGRSIAAALGIKGMRAKYAPLERAAALQAACGGDVSAVSVIGLTEDEASVALDIIEALNDAGAPTIVLTDEGVEQITIAKSIAAGAVGVISTTQPLAALTSAVIAAAEGNQVLSLSSRYELEDVLRSHLRDIQTSLAPFRTLTQREAEVLNGLIAGKRAEQLASESFVALSTVRSQIKAVLHKLEVHSQLEAVALAHDAHWPLAASG